MKALGLEFRTRRFLKIAIWKPIYWPVTLLTQPTGPVWTTLIGDHPGSIPVKFGQNPISGFRVDAVLRNCWRNDGQTDGRRTLKDHKSSPSELEKIYGQRTTHKRRSKVTIACPEQFVLRWTKKWTCCVCSIWNCVKYTSLAKFS